MRKIVMLLGLLLVGRSLAGAQLTTQQLLKEATPGGVALVVNHIDGEVVFQEWLSPTHFDASLGALRGPCAPSRSTLEAWTTAHPQHPGRATWDAVRKDGQSTQVVFLAVRDGRLVPVCESEVENGTTFSQHPQHAALLEELRTSMPIPAPPLPPSTPPTPPTPASASDAPIAAPPAPPSGAGCW